MTIILFTNTQQTLIKERADDPDTWRDEVDLDRRRRVATELQNTVKHSGVLDQGTLDHRTLCRLVDLQWQIQNLNQMQMPRLLGLYHYKVHFRGFDGTREDLLAIREAESGEAAMYEGADLATVSEAIRLMASDSRDNHYRGTRKLLEEPGAGEALVSGFLHLLHPKEYALVNSAATGPFAKDGWLEVTKDQRRKALVLAREQCAGVVEESDRVLRLIFRWQVFLDEVRELCGYRDFHEVDQFVWTLQGGERKNPREILTPVVAAIPGEKENVRVRAEAEAKARALIEKNLGSLTGEQFAELFELVNTCMGKNGVVYTRIAPALVGHNANKLVERASDLNTWVRELWTVGEEELPKLLDRFWEQKFTGGGSSLPTTILYLRDKERYFIWTPNLERGLYCVVNGAPAKMRTGFSYLQYCDRLRRLRKLLDIPPELLDWVLFKVITAKSPRPPGQPSGVFRGFDLAAFQFMADLVANNNHTWFDANRERFRQSVDKPLRALVKDLGDEVITSLDPGLEKSAKANKCISRIRKNVYGRQEEDVYQDLYWAAFYRKDRTKQTDCQFFMSVRGTGFQYGIFFGEQADDVRMDLLNALETHRSLGERVFAQFQKAAFLFVPEEGDGPADPIQVADYSEFLTLVKNHHFNVVRQLTPEDAVAAGPDLKNKIGTDFRTLYPLFLLAVSQDPQKDVSPHLPPDDDDGENGDGEDEITFADLAASTYMEEAFFAKLDQYLKDKQQIIFFGPPGTGKTYVALQYAKYLSQDGGEVRTVQFHPSYSYEDFMEGLRPFTRGGQLSYEVQDGIFKNLCDDARAKPKATFVLLVDEINRGNLPRIFGELLFLLERREETAQLPYSKRPFSIPRNIVILGTMNSSDRSIALMDLALRRRFHFVTMEPRTEVLLAWLKDKKKPLWIKDLFDRLNDELRAEGIDDDRLIGHAHFMSALVGDEYVELIWEGTIEPMLREFFFTEPEKLTKFRLENFQPELAAAEGDELGAESDDESEELNLSHDTNAEVT